MVRMIFALGDRIGPYEIKAVLGAGGMGEVYRARDTRLNRDVAIKVLPPAFSADPDRLRRFEQEARAAAALNHPNILAVYDIGVQAGSPYVVSELLDGQTLRELLEAGPLSVRKSVDYAVQIAHGLEAAHEKGIVHRDLKPENLLLTSNGRVKIVDFGLAKLMETPADPELPASSTRTSMTTPGTILGTVGYMSPEQVRGLPADQRSDLFAFGAILYEMLSGARAFGGDTAADTMTAILKDSPPPLGAKRQDLPRTLERIVDRCLEKAPSARFQSASDLAFALEGLPSYSDSVSAAHAGRGMMRRERLAWLLAGLFGVAILTAAALARLSGARIEAPIYRSSILPPEHVTFATTSPAGWLALSPDGQRLAFTAAGQDRRVLLWVRSLDGLTSQPLVGTDGAQFPFWSPDSRYLGFFAEGKLKKIDAAGGTPVALCDMPRRNAPAAGGTWNRDGVILFALVAAPLYRVPAAGGTPAPVTTLDEAQGETQHFEPFFLADGRHFLYFAVGTRTGGPDDPHGIYVASIDSPDRKLLIHGGSNAEYASGQLIFLRDRTLMAQPFDSRRLELIGDAVPVADQVAIGGLSGRTGAFSVTETGVLAYQTGSGEVQSQLVWFDRAGKEMAVLGDSADYGDLELSPDRTHATVSVHDPATRTRDIWLFDLVRGLRTRFTFDPADELTSLWSPDGARVVFNSRRKGYLDLYSKASSGADSEDVLLADTRNKTPTSWSADGRFLLYSTNALAAGNTDLWLLPLSGNRKASPFLQMPFNESLGRFSPDGRWVAYASNETGRTEIYVTHFPGPGGKWQISTTGGSYPRWRPDGRELFYLTPDNNLTAATVSGQRTAFQVEAARSLFTIHPRTGQRYPYDVASDGQRFLVNTIIDATALPPITLVVNWTTGLHKPERW
jgi:Tol biopolymer transport system component/predicted Ser/Thr protein kinase